MTNGKLWKMTNGKWFGLLLMRGFCGSLRRRLLRQESSDLSAKILCSRRIIVPLNYNRVAAIPEDIQIRVDPRRAAAVTPDALSFDRLVDESVAVLGAHRRVYFSASQLLV